MSNPPFTYKFYTTTAQAWDAMYQAILGAQKSIFWEIYILLDDTAGTRFVEALCAKAKVGLEVKLVLDAVGSLSFTAQSQKKLKEAGVDLVWFNALGLAWNPITWLNRLWRRNHRKVLIIDEGLAFLGGVNVEAEAANWSDLYIKITGKVVRPLLRGFAKSYIHALGPRKNVRRLLHPKLMVEFKEWRAKIKFITHSPVYASHRFLLKNLYYRALELAKESVTLVSPYYVPDKKFLRLIAEAKARGVKVKIILPWRPYHWFMEHLAQSFYNLTYRAGAELYFVKKMMHGKALSMDDKTGFVGSSNLTPRSFNLNEESGVFFSEEKMVKELNGILDDWQKEAVPFGDVSLKKQSWFGRLISWLANKLRDYV